MSYLVRVIGVNAVSYLVRVIMPSGERATNALRFATYEEAYAHGFHLLARWTLPEDYVVEESADPPNYAWRDGELVRLTDADAVTT